MRATHPPTHFSHLRPPVSTFGGVDHSVATGSESASVAIHLSRRTFSVGAPEVHRLATRGHHLIPSTLFRDGKIAGKEELDNAGDLA